MPIIDGAARHRQSYHEYFETLRHHPQFAPHLGELPPPPISAADAKAPVQPLIAYIDASRWCVACQYCPATDYLWYNTPMFMCPACANDADEGQWLQVTIPADFLAVNAEMQKRETFSPKVQNIWMNWAAPGTINCGFKTQTLEQLRQETKMLEDGVR